MTVTALPDGRLAGTAKRVTPVRAKTAVKSVLRAYGCATSRFRQGPDYLIIGAKRCGTTSMHNYLLGHPDVASLFPAAERIKGIHYFDRQPYRSEMWYRSFFPIRRSARRLVIGEASPYYLIHPAAAERAARVAPEAKIIALVREPAERALSHYRDERGLGNETLSFREAINAEPDRVAAELRRMAADPNYYSFVHEHLCYLSWGRYAEHLERWASFFPREQMLVLRSEDLFAKPEETVRRVTDFLDLPAHAAGTYPRYNATRLDAADSAVIQELRAYYRPFNAQLRLAFPDLVLWDEPQDRPWPRPAYCK